MKTPRYYQIAGAEYLIEGIERNEHSLLVMATGCGKCLGRGTPVLMYDGTSVPVESVKPGDLLMGPDSKPRTVISVGSGEGELFRVEQNKGESYVTNGDHILSLKMTGGFGRGKSGAYKEITVNDYLKQNKTFKHCAKGWKASVEWPIRDVPLHPYFLGLWLGDGNARNQGISKPDHEVSDFLAEYAESFGMKLVTRDQHRCPIHYITRSEQSGGNAILDLLRSIGVINNRHVPTDYKVNSRSVRLQVLAGIIDTDGSLSGGCYDYITKSKKLANDVCFLARSLGLNAKVTQCEKQCVNNGKWGVYHRLCISGDISMIPCRIERKKASPRKQKKNPLLCGIKVEPAGYGEYFGFVIDGDGLFMLGDFTVTHNTVTACKVIRHFTDRGHNMMFMVRKRRLVEQAYRAICEEIGAENVLMEMADRRAYLRPHGGLCVVASKDTLKGRRLKSWPRDGFKGIILDEAHSGPAKGNIAIFDHFQAVRLGLTATPGRQDKISLGTVFTRSRTIKSLLEGIDEGFLAPLEPHFVKVKGLDLSKVKRRKEKDDTGKMVEADFMDKEIDPVLNADKVVLEMVKATLEVAGDRPTLFFCNSVRHAAHVSAVVNAIQPDTCEYIASYRVDESGNKVELTDANETDENVDLNAAFCWRQQERFCNGELKRLASCSMLLEGVDLPPTACISMLRPSKNIWLITQILGRGTRTMPPNLPDLHPTPVERKTAIASSVKPACLVLDFVGNTGRHKLVRSVDVIMAQKDHEYLAKVRQELEESGGSLQDAEKKIKDKLAEAAAKAKQTADDEARKAQEFYDRLPRFDQVRRYVAQNAEVSYTTHYVPLDEGRGAYQTESKARYPASPAQQEALLKLSKQLNHGLTADQIAAMDVRDVTRRITHLRVKRAKGAPSSGQAYVIRKAGYAVPATWDQAHQLIDKIKRANGGQLP